jgi:hypothetical protein
MSTTTLDPETADQIPKPSDQPTRHRRIQLLTVAETFALLRRRYPGSLVCVECAKLISTLQGARMEPSERDAFRCAECRAAAKATPPPPWWDSIGERKILDRLIWQRLAVLEGRRWTLRKVLRVVAASETTGVPRCQHRRHLEIAAAKMSPCPEGCAALTPGGALSNEGVVLASYPPRLGGDRENSPEKARQNGGSDAQGAPPVQGEAGAA